MRRATLRAASSCRERRRALRLVASLALAAPLALGAPFNTRAEEPVRNGPGKGIGAGTSSGTVTGTASDASTGASAIAQLRRFIERAQSARGRFVQRTERASGRAAQELRGTFAFDRPGRFRWEIREPFEQLLVADGEKLYFYDRDLEQVTVRSVGEAIGASPAAILFGAEDIEATFELTGLGTRDGLQWLAAVPRARDAGVERIEIGFSDDLPRAMRVQDAFGGVAILEFHDIEIGPVLPEDAFRFVPPPGADVIRQ